MFHRGWFGQDVHVYPLTYEKIRCVSACFKGASYDSFKNYVRRAKDVHVELGHEWTLQLQRLTAKAVRSVARGRGPVRQCLSADLVKIASAASAGKTDYENMAVDMTVFAPLSCSERSK